MIDNSLLKSLISDLESSKAKQVEAFQTSVDQIRSRLANLQTQLEEGQTVLNQLISTANVTIAGLDGKIDAYRQLIVPDPSPVLDLS